MLHRTNSNTVHSSQAPYPSNHNSTMRLPSQRFLPMEGAKPKGTYAPRACPSAQALAFEALYSIDDFNLQATSECVGGMPGKRIPSE